MIRDYSAVRSRDPESRDAVAKLARATKAKANHEAYERHMSEGRSLMSSQNYSMAAWEFERALSKKPGDSMASSLLTQAKKSAAKQKR